MANMEALNDEALEAANGGAAKVNTTDASGAHFQNTLITMGTAYYAEGRGGKQLWYRVKTGDTLGAIAARYGTTVQQIQKNNPKTITNINDIYAGDCLFIKYV